MPVLNIDPIISLGQNIAFLLCLPLVCHFVWRILKRAPKPLNDLATGIVFALVAIIGMLSPLRVVPGLIIDGRVAIIAIAALYSTPVGIITTVIIAAFRFVLGGVGMPPAEGTIFTALVIGIAARKYFSVRLNKGDMLALWLISMALVFATAIWAFLVPSPESKIAFLNNILPILIWYPSSTLLLGSLFAQELSREEVENELRASNERYYSIVNDQVDLVARWKPDGTLTFVNDAYAQYFRRSRSELIGQTLFFLLHERLKEEVRHTVNDLTPQNPMLKKTVYLDVANQQNHWFEWVHRAFFNQRNEMIEIQSVGRDVTEQLDAKKREAYQHDFERRLITLATGFINVPSEQVDQAITNALKEVGEFLDSSRCAINVVDSELTSFTRNYEWRRNSQVPSRLGMIDPLPDSENLIKLLKSGEKIIIRDINQVSEYPELARLMKMMESRSIVMIPMFRTGRLREVITITWQQPAQIQPESIDLLRVLGEIYLNAVERKEHDEELRQMNIELEQRVSERTVELSDANDRLKLEITERKQAQDAEHEQRILAEALRDTAAAINSTLKLDEVLDRILINIDHVVKHDVANVMLIIEGDVARIVRYRGYSALSPETVNTIRFPIVTTPNLKWMVENRKPRLIADVKNEPNWVRIPELDWLNSYLGVPICQGDEVIGFLGLDSAVVDFFTEEHALRLQAFADQAAIAIKNAQIYEQANEIAAMQERQRLARELHDSVSQMLFSANSIAESLTRVLQRHPEKTQQYIANLRNFTRGAMAEMRTLLIELRPEALIRTELALLLSQLCDAFTGRTQVAVERNFTVRSQFPPDVQIAFYRIAQEAFNNITKHANATTATISLGIVDDNVEMRIKDNGTGFDPSYVPHDHFGIQIMQERAAAIEAKFELHSQIGHGSEIVIRRKLDD